VLSPFPQPREADLSDITPDFEYPPALEAMNDREITAGIKRVLPHKSTGPDQIPNEILAMTLPVIVPALLQNFNASVNLMYCPKHFQESTTVIVRKPDKGDYQNPKN
jgi:hypothetical protein